MSMGKQKLKILHFPVSYPDPDDGKPYHMIFIAEHIRCASLLHDNVVLVGSQKVPDHGRLLHVGHQNENNLLVIRYSKRKLGVPVLDRILYYYLLAKEMLKLWRKGFWPDVVHIHIFSEARLPVLLANLLKIPVVVTEHWSGLCRPGFLSSKRLRLARHIYESAAIVLPVSEHLRRCIQENTQAHFQFQIILNAVNTNDFHWLPTNKIQKSPYQILMVARLEEPKDITTVLEALQLVSRKGISFHFSLIGRGVSDPFIKLAQKLEISDRVDFLGERPKSEIASRMRQSDLFVFASLWENSPCVIGEALCCGLPVVATAVGGVPELVPPNAGMLVPPKDALALANASIEILSHPERFNREVIALEAQGRFSYETIGSQLDEVYREVILD